MSSPSSRQYISSSSNARIKTLRKLATSAGFRMQSRQTVAHGPHLCASYMSAPREVAYYIVASSAVENDEIFGLLNSLAEQGVPGIELPDSLYESLSDVHARVGISLVIPLPVLSAPAPLDQDAILLEGIQDPGNLGTILRTACAAGVKQVYLSPDCASAWAPKTLRSGMGAQFGVDIYESVDLAGLISHAKIPVYATTLASDSVSLYEAPLDTAVAWVVGSEGRGISTEIQSLATLRVHIPQANPAVESLNVAAAAAICLYERVRVSEAAI